MPPVQWKRCDDCQLVCPWNKFSRATRSIPGILSVYRMTGDLDYLIRARVADVRAYDRLYQKLISKVALRDVSASFVMEEIKETTRLPVG